MSLHVHSSKRVNSLILSARVQLSSSSNNFNATRITINFWTTRKRVFVLDIVVFLAAKFNK